jgi:electron transfer flavoprotein alpha/beta subunit
MAARSKSIESRSLADVGADGSVGGEAATNRVLGSEAPPARAATRVVRDTPEGGANQIVALLAERRII